VLFIESGRDLTTGTYLNLDALSMAKNIDGKLVNRRKRDNDTILDDIKFIEKYIK